MIGVCGCGLVGSDAVLHLLSEYKDVNVLRKREFVLTYFPDGIEDLEYHLVEQNSKFFSSDIAIKRFLELSNNICHNKKSYYYKLTDGHFNELVNKYIDSLIQVKWKGRWMFDDYVFYSVFKKIKYFICNKLKLLNDMNLRTMYFSVNPDNFYKETKEFLKKVYNYHNREGLFVIDQPFPSNNPIKSMKLYGEDSKAIVLLRDPRDIYIENQERVNKGLKVDWIPFRNIDGFIEYYRRMYTIIDNPNIMYLNVEDLAFDYENTVKKINDFCGIEEYNHVKKYKYYNPENGKKFTQLFIKNKKYGNDIKKIEKELSKYLYDFDSIKEDHDFANNCIY